MPILQVYAIDITQVDVYHIMCHPKDTSNVRRNAGYFPCYLPPQEAALVNESFARR